MAKEMPAEQPKKLKKKCCKKYKKKGKYCKKCPLYWGRVDKSNKLKA